jgi:hypothetical protein
MTPSTRLLRSMVAAVLFAGCGARTVLREPADGGEPAADAPATLDAPVSPDVPVGPDVPVTPDRPVIPDILPSCADFQTLCAGRCTDTRSDDSNCGACGRACGDSRCVNGDCRMAGCPDLQLLCGVRCVDPLSDPSNCGACGSVCPPGLRCQMGSCFGDCGGPGRVLCGRTCVDVVNDPSNCGGCGVTCAPDMACLGGRCAVPCDGPGLTLCGSSCVDVRSDALHCGACGRACPPGLTCADARCAPPRPLEGRVFRIRSLGGTCRAVEHNRLTGDDRGGIAVSSTRVFYTGDLSTGRFDLDSLNGEALGRMDDGLVSDLATGQLYSLRASGRPVVSNGVGHTVTELALLDGTTGAPIGRSIVLSRPIPLMGDVGIFAGLGRVAFHDGQRAYDVDLASGAVTDLGRVALPFRTQSCESWAYWGVVEFFGGSLHLTYVRDVRTVVRTRVPDGVTTTVATFANLSDMCSFTASPLRGRWYWHHEGNSQFRSGDESLGFCEAAFDVGDIDPP